MKNLSFFGLLAVVFFFSFSVGCKSTDVMEDVVTDSVSYEMSPTANILKDAGVIIHSYSSSSAKKSAADVVQAYLDDIAFVPEQDGTQIVSYSDFGGLIWGGTFQDLPAEYPEYNFEFTADIWDGYQFYGYSRFIDEPESARAQTGAYMYFDHVTGKARLILGDHPLGSSSVSIACHELGHALDISYGWPSLYDPQFRVIAEDIRSRAKAGEYELGLYYTPEGHLGNAYADNIQRADMEIFAEWYAQWCKDPEYMRTNFPQFVQYVTEDVKSFQAPMTKSLHGISVFVEGVEVPKQLEAKGVTRDEYYATPFKIKK